MVTSRSQVHACHFGFKCCSVDSLFLWVIWKHYRKILSFLSTTYTEKLSSFFWICFQFKIRLKLRECSVMEVCQSPHWGEFYWLVKVKAPLEVPANGLSNIFIMLLLNRYQSALQVVAWIYFVLFLFVMKDLTLFDQKDALISAEGKWGLWEPHQPHLLVVCDVCQSFQMRMEIPFALRAFYILPGYFKAGSM